MDFSSILQLKNKKFWWMDVAFYFVISALIATILCYVIFLVKNNFQREGIQEETTALQTVGTVQQNEYEKYVIDYQKKIDNYASLLKNHEFASNVLAFMGEETMPNVWYKQFGLDEKTGAIQLSGESDGLDALSRQVVSFENNKYVQSIGTLNSTLGDSARVEFNIGLLTDPSIFNYIDNQPKISETTAALEQNPIQPSQTNSSTSTTANTTANSQQTIPVKSSEKSITSFQVLSSPEVAGVIDETNYVITLNVPYGTDIKNLSPIIVVSPGATALPASNVSQDFTSPVAYIITAQDGSVQNYTVRAVVSAAVKSGNASGQFGLSTLIAILLAVIIIIAVVVIILFFWKKMSVQKTQV